MADSDPNDKGGHVEPRPIDLLPKDEGSWTEEHWKTWYDAQPRGVQTMLDRQSQAANNFTAIRERLGESFDVIDQAMRDESGEEVKRLSRLRDPRFKDFVFTKATKTFDEVYGDLSGGEGDRNPRGGGDTEVIKRLDKLDERLTREDLEKARDRHVEERNREFLALAREVPDLFAQADEATDPEAKAKNDLARKRTERIISLAEQRSKAQFGDQYFVKGQRVALKDVLDDMLAFNESRSEPPLAAVRLSRSGAADKRREPEPTADPEKQREIALNNMRAGGGFAKIARAGRG